MDDADVRSLKAQKLRDAALELRRHATVDIDPETNKLLAHLLTQRAARIVAGEDDHSAIPLMELTDTPAVLRSDL